jgi:hypothetical protein
MISVLASTTVGSMDADEEPTGMYSRRVVEVSAEVRSCTMLMSAHSTFEAIHPTHESF